MYTDVPKGQSSPGILQSGQQPSNGILQIPQLSSLATHLHIQKSFPKRLITVGLQSLTEQCVMANAFPLKNYPNQIIFDGKAKKSFREYGCFNAVDVSSDHQAGGISESSEFTFQKFHGKHGTVKDFYAVDPSIPLLPPHGVTTEEYIYDDFYYFKKDKMPKGGRYKWRHKNRAVDHLSYLYEEYPDIGFGSSLKLLKADWPKQKKDKRCNKFYTKQASARLNSFLSDFLHEIPQDLLYNYVFEELQTAALNLVKEASLTIQKGIFERCNFHKGEGSLMLLHVCPFIPGECAFALENGNLYLWTGQRLQDIDQTTVLFPSRDKWVHCHFAGHPRLLVITDRTGLRMKDCRMTDRQVEKSLFALPSPCVDVNDRVMVTRQHPSNHFHHYIATKRSMLLVDERFPGKPVLTWEHQLQSPPMYMDILDNVRPGEHVILLSTQRTKETHCIVHTSSSGVAAQGVGLPWRIAPPNSWLPSMKKSCQDDRIYQMMDRRLQSTLLGMCAIRHSNQDAFTVLQITSGGDIVYQSYSACNTGDKTACPGIGFKPKRLLGENKARCQQWIDDITELHKNQPVEVIHPNLARTETCNVRHAFTRMSKCSTSHPCCRLCGQDGSGEQGELTNWCQRCGISTIEGSRLFSCYKDNKVVTSSRTFQLAEDDDDIYSIDKVINLVNLEACKDQMSSRLWNTWHFGYDKRGNIKNTTEISATSSSGSEFEHPTPKRKKLRKKRQRRLNIPDTTETDSVPAPTLLTLNHPTQSQSMDKSLSSPRKKIPPVKKRKMKQVMGF
uniref:Uncharacterized protein LOC100371809 n=1 Tax=Saccoglossus kowalevskii TaxID=10224 RepID=A0ABM0GIX9_SACKO|nr:PREDICTED: uncharacterized protein LOC100371809 [Saccoglossus kowalevskii]